MRKFTTVIAALVVSLTMSSVASASVITTGNLDYNNVSNVITDSISGETYLGWDLVKALNYDQTIDITFAGGLYDDWHIATQTEAYNFYNAATGAGIADGAGTQVNSTTIGAFVDGVPFGDNGGSVYDYAFFLSDEAGYEVGILELRGNLNRVRMFEGWGDFFDSDFHSLTPPPPHSPRAQIGWLLVGGSTTKLPEPSIIALFGLGLVGIGFARRRRQA
jgi:hypothetical protein